MHKFLFLYLSILFTISISSSTKFLSKSFFSSLSGQYTKINPSILKKSLGLKDFYVIDTRDISKAALGYISNTLIVPISMLNWLSSVVPNLASIIVITESSNYITTLNKIESYGRYKIYGYCFYDEVTKFPYFDIKKIEYNQNTKESIQDIVNSKGNIIDVREVNEYHETGVIKEAKLIPLSTFLNKYSNIPKNGDVYVFCKSGMRAVIAMSFAKRYGFTNNFIIMKGGITQAIREGYPLVHYIEK